MPKRTLDAVHELVLSHLAAQGVVRTETPGVFGLTLNSEVLGFIGLNAVTKYGIEIIPHVGVHHIALEKALCRHLQTDWHPYSPPTIGTAIGYVMPAREYVTWDIPKNEEWPRVVHSMSVAIDRYGLAFMQKHASLMSIYHAILESRKTDHPLWLYKLCVYPWRPLRWAFFRLRVNSWDQRFAYHLPVACLLLGQKSQARVLVEEEVHRLGDATYPYANQYRCFAASLLAECG